MEKSMRKLPAALVVVASLTSPFAVADDLLGLYVGGNVGESTVRSDDNFAVGGYGFDGFYHDANHHFAWKALAGIRPISLVGAELEYVDFGHPGGDGEGYYGSSLYYGPDSHPRALAAFAVGYLPLPVPFIDVFVKAGAARLHTNVNGFDGPGCGASPGCGQSVAFPAEDRWDTRFAYGAGLQSRVWGLTLRAEYERVSSPYGDPDMASVGAYWTF